MYVCVRYCIVLRATTQAYYLISPTYEGMSSAWLGNIAASSSAAVEVCASALLPISHGVLAGQQLTMRHTALYGAHFQRPTHTP